MATARQKDHDRKLLPTGGGQALKNRAGKKRYLPRMKTGLGICMNIKLASIGLL
jgi:hypothetical protein